MSRKSLTLVSLLSPRGELYVITSSSAQKFPKNFRMEIRTTPGRLVEVSLAVILSIVLVLGGLYKV